MKSAQEMSKGRVISYELKRLVSLRDRGYMKTPTQTPLTTCTIKAD